MGSHSLGFYLRRLCATRRWLTVSLVLALSLGQSGCINFKGNSSSVDSPGVIALGNIQFNDPVGIYSADFIAALDPNQASSLEGCPSSGSFPDFKNSTRSHTIIGCTGSAGFADAPRQFVVGGATLLHVHPDPQASGTPRTIDVVVNVPNAVASNQVLFRSSDNALVVYAQLTGNGKLVVSVAGAQTVFNTLTPGWHDIVLSIAGSQTEVYLDGADQGSAPGTVPPIQELQFGDPDSSGNSGFSGPLGIVAVYQVAMNATQAGQTCGEDSIEYPALVCKP